MAAELIDKFVGAADAALVGHSPQTGTAWSGSTSNMYPGSDVRLTGDGYTYNARVGSSLILTPTTFSGSVHQIIFPMRFLTDIGAGNTYGMALYEAANASGTDSRIYWNAGFWKATIGTNVPTSAFAFPASGTVVLHRVTATDGATRSILFEISTDGGASWTTLFGGAKTYTADASPFAPGPWYDAQSSKTTGVQIGEMVVWPTAVSTTLAVSPTTFTVSTPGTLTLSIPGGYLIPGTPGLPTATVSPTTNGVALSSQVISDFDAGTVTLNPGSATASLTVTVPGQGSATVTVAAVLVAGTATAGSTTTTTAAATATEATGGTAPYTHQWYRSTTSGQLGSIVSGQTTTTLADTGLTPATTYYYTLRYTDATTAHVDSNQINEITASASATAYTLTGPSSGTVNVASTNFTVSPNGTYSGTVTITPSGGGLSTPIVKTFSASSTPQTFTITPTATGAVTLTPTNNGSLTNPSALTYTSLAVSTHNQLSAYYPTPSLTTIYYVILSPGKAWNGSAFEALNASHWSTYAVAGADAAATSLYLADFPATIPIGTYSAYAYKQAGSSPASTDLPIAGPQTGYWDGTNFGGLAPSGAATASFDSGAVSSTPFAPTATDFWATGAGLLGASGDYVGMSVLFQTTGKPARSRKVSAHSVVAGVHHFTLTWSGYPALPSAPASGDSFDLVP